MSICSSRGPGFDSHHPHGGFQLSLTAAVGDLTHSSDLHGYQACMWYTGTHVGKHSYTLNDKLKFKIQKIILFCLAEFQSSNTRRSSDQKVIQYINDAKMTPKINSEMKVCCG